MNVEMLQQVTGSVIKGVSGRITSLAAYKYEEQGEHGPSSFQPGKFKLDSGEVVAVVFKNQFTRNGGDLKPLIGKHVTLASHDGDRGLTGVKVGDYKGAVQLVVTATADILEVGNTAGAAPQPPASQPASAPAAPAAPKAPPAKPANDTTPEQALQAAKEFVAHNRTLAMIVLKATATLDKEYEATYGGPMTEQVFCTIYTSLIFGAERSLNLAALPKNVDFKTLLPIVAHPEGSK